jgi:hypothetical protein
LGKEVILGRENSSENEQKETEWLWGFLHCFPVPEMPAGQPVMITLKAVVVFVSRAVKSQPRAGIPSSLQDTSI